MDAASEWWSSCRQASDDDDDDVSELFARLDARAHAGQPTTNR